MNGPRDGILGNVRHHDRLRVACVWRPWRVTFDRRAIFGRKAATRLEPHDAVRIEQQDRRPLDADAVAQRVEGCGINLVDRERLPYGSRQRQTHGAVRIGGRQHRRGTPVSDRGRKAGSAKAQSSSHRKYSQRLGGNSPSEDRQIGAFPDGTFHPAGQDSTPWPLASAPGSPRALPRRQTAGPGSVLPGMQRAADLSPNGIRCPARPERWDYYESRGCRPFKYRHRTRLLVVARLG